MKTRFAPTPSGYLHLGNVLSFSLTAYLAKRENAPVLLRIDDMDENRVRHEYLNDIFSVIPWLGLSWQEGPTDIYSFEKQYSQKTRIGMYEKALSSLREAGLIFACSCSRSTFADCACEKNELPLDKGNMQWRVRTDEISLDPCLQHFTVRNKDGNPTYQLCSVVDDLHFDIKRIVRGSDLHPSSCAQKFLAACLPENTFHEIVFYHHTLLAGDDGRKMSKSEGATSIQYLIRNGYKKQDIFQLIGRRCGLKERVTDWQSLGEALMPYLISSS